MNVDKEKKNIICKFDNKNQNLVMQNKIDKHTYNHNKRLIHRLYDERNNYTIQELLFELSYFISWERC